MRLNSKEKEDILFLGYCHMNKTVYRKKNWSFKFKLSKVGVCSSPQSSQMRLRSFALICPHISDAHFYWISAHSHFEIFLRLLLTVNEPLLMDLNLQLK